MRTNIIYSLLFFVALLLLGSCESDTTETKTEKNPVALKVNAPLQNSMYTIGDNIGIDLEVVDATDIQNLTITFDDAIIREDLDIKTQSISIKTTDFPVGFSTISISYIDKVGKARKASRNIVLFSDITPAQKIASIVGAYPHKTSAYTQGLEFYKGQLYESTGSGDGNKSFIAKVDLATGAHLAYKPLENQSYFGEGITILNDTIYQLTWESGQCMVYDLNFNFIKSFTYNGEGWGLTNNGKSLIMSNGTSTIVWRNPRTFEIERKIDVFGNEQDIPALNELELIDGDLYCNVYQQNYLVQVDTTTGKLLAYIDCAGIVREGMDINANVLNGIAYNQATKKLYLTGKLWPKLFEVKID